VTAPSATGEPLYRNQSIIAKLVLRQAKLIEENCIDVIGGKSSWRSPPAYSGAS
jgi:hypothetical protein